MQEILDILLSVVIKNIKVEVDKNLYRLLDVPLIICDNNKLVSETGWQPKKS